MCVSLFMKRLVCVLCFKIFNATMAQVFILLPRFCLRLRRATAGAASSALEPSASQRASVVSRAIGEAPSSGQGFRSRGTRCTLAEQTRPWSCRPLQKEKEAVVVVSLRQTVVAGFGGGGFSANAPANCALSQLKTLSLKKLVISRNVPGGFPLARYAGKLPRVSATCLL